LRCEARVGDARRVSEEGINSKVCRSKDKEEREKVN